MKKSILALILFLFSGSKETFPVLSFDLLVKGNQRRLLLSAFHTQELSEVIKLWTSLVAQQLICDESHADNKVKVIYEFNKADKISDWIFDEGINYLLTMKNHENLTFEAYDPRESESSCINGGILAWGEHFDKLKEKGIVGGSWKDIGVKIRAKQPISVKNYLKSLEQSLSFIEDLRDKYNPQEPAYHVLNEKYKKLVAGETKAREYFSNYENRDLSAALNKIVKEHAQYKGLIYMVATALNFIEELEEALLVNLDYVIADAGFFAQSMDAAENLVFYAGDAHFRQLIEDHKQVGYDSISSGSTMEKDGRMYIYLYNKQYYDDLTNAVLKLQRGIEYNFIDKEFSAADDKGQIKMVCAACGNATEKYIRCEICKKVFYCNKECRLSGLQSHQQACSVAPMYHNCNFCGASEQKLLRCIKCKKTYYCNKDCQRSDWKAHKLTCKEAPLLQSCGQCGKTDDKLLRCSKCKKTYYCNHDCQKLAWKEHKTNCALEK